MRSEPVARGGERFQLALITAALAIGTGFLYGQVLGFGFVDVDDPTYVSDNFRVQRGLTTANLVWAFTSMSVANWHPLTWLSHMLDVELHGLDAGGHHLGNLVLHIANTLLLFGLLRSLTGAMWRSASVAALFAIHPLHVESVAWVSERKDVLCTFFWFLAMWSYATQVRLPSAKPGQKPKLALPCILTACALLAKPMAVTLPFVLLLLDYWPLRRLDRGSFRQRVEEKLPFFALSLTSSVLTVLAQRAGGAMESSSDVSVWLRLANAAVSYATYLVKCVLPVDLAYLYPHPYIPGTGGTPWGGWQIAGAIAALLTISGLVALLRRSYLTIGWLWYLGTLVPTIGILQVGTQAYADRYTYVPLVGIFIAVVWGAADWCTSLRGGSRRAVQVGGLVGGLAVLVTLGSLSRVQLTHWRASMPLFEHALAVRTDNTISQLALAAALASEERPDEAMEHAKRAIELKPDYGEAYATMGRVHRLNGRHQLALQALQRAVRLSPHSPRVRFNLGTQLVVLGQLEASVSVFERAAELDPDWPNPRAALADVLRRRGRAEEAVDQYRFILERQPELNDVRLALANTLALLGQREAAITEYEQVLAREPKHAKARYLLDRTRNEPQADASQHP